jgi:hypothetical protein
MTKNRRKHTAKKYYFIFEFSGSLGLHRASKLQKKPSALQRENPALQNMKFLNFSYFRESWVIFALLDPNPDPRTRLNPDPDPRP